MDASFGSEDNLLSFTRSSPSAHGRTVLNLVFQAAEIFSGMEEQLRETEAHAQSMCKSAEERAQSAEAQLHDAKQALLLVEEAIRERLLSEKRPSVEG